MAMRLSTVRRLIDDDVGIGETIEARFVRELMDRGETCPNGRRIQKLIRPKKHE